MSKYFFLILSVSLLSSGWATPGNTLEGHGETSLAEKADSSDAYLPSKTHPIQHGVIKAFVDRFGCGRDRPKKWDKNGDLVYNLKYLILRPATQKFAEQLQDAIGKGISPSENVMTREYFKSQINSLNGTGSGLEAINEQLGDYLYEVFKNVYGKYYDESGKTVDPSTRSAASAQEVAWKALKETNAKFDTLLSKFEKNIQKYQQDPSGVADRCKNVESALGDASRDIATNQSTAATIKEANDLAATDTSKYSDDDLKKHSEALAAAKKKLEALPNSPEKAAAEKKVEAAQTNVKKELEAKKPKEQVAEVSASRWDADSKARKDQENSYQTAIRLLTDIPDTTGEGGFSQDLYGNVVMNAIGDRSKPAILKELSKFQGPAARREVDPDGRPVPGQESDYERLAMERAKIDMVLARTQVEIKKRAGEIKKIDGMLEQAGGKIDPSSPNGKRYLEIVEEKKKLEAERENLLALQRRGEALDFQIKQRESKYYSRDAAGGSGPPPAKNIHELVSDLALASTVKDKQKAVATAKKSLKNAQNALASSSYDPDSDAYKALQATRNSAIGALDKAKLELERATQAATRVAERRKYLSAVKSIQERTAVRFSPTKTYTAHASSPESPTTVDRLVGEFVSLAAANDLGAEFNADRISGIAKNIEPIISSDRKSVVGYSLKNLQESDLVLLNIKFEEWLKHNGYEIKPDGTVSKNK